jgi:hypothetical protein
MLAPLYKHVKNGQVSEYGSHRILPVADGKSIHPD